jgi:hypothetical protein
MRRTRKTQSLLNIKTGERIKLRENEFGLGQALASSAVGESE